MHLKPLLILSLCCLSTFAHAKPAPWYWWASRSSDAVICAQTSPGSGWQREGRAFKDSHCSIRL